MKKLFLFLLILSQYVCADAWHFEARAVSSLKIQCEVNGVPYSVQEGMRSRYPAGGIRGSTLPPDGGGYADREFLDGYVKKDPGTGVHGSLAAEDTWYWGYDNAGQYDSTTGMLTFHTPVFQQLSESYSSSVTENSSIRHKEDFPASGLDLSLGYDFLRKERWTLRWCMGLTIYEETDLEYSSRLYQEQGRRFSEILKQQGIYTYDTNGVTLPAPGHQGSYDGPFASPPPAVSPLIPNRPSGIVIQDLGSSPGTVQEYSRTEVTADCDFSARLSELNLGGRIYYELTPALNLHASLHLLCALVECSGGYSEQFLQTGTAGGNVLAWRHWKDSADTDRLLLGISCGAGLEYRLTRRLSLGAGILRKQYFDKIRTGLGPGEIELDFSSMGFDLYLGWQF